MTGLETAKAIIAMPAMGVMAERFLRVTCLGQVLWLEDPAAATPFESVQAAERALNWLQPGAYVRRPERPLRRAACIPLTSCPEVTAAQQGFRALRGAGR